MPDEDDAINDVRNRSVPGNIALRELGIDEAQAANLRASFACFADDWERPEMDDYDRL